MMVTPAVIAGRMARRLQRRQSPSRMPWRRLVVELLEPRFALNGIGLAGPEAPEIALPADDFSDAVVGDESASGPDAAETADAPTDCTEGETTDASESGLESTGTDSDQAAVCYLVLAEDFLPRHAGDAGGNADGAAAADSDAGANSAQDDLFSDDRSDDDPLSDDWAELDAGDQPEWTFRGVHVDPSAEHDSSTFPSDTSPDGVQVIMFSLMGDHPPGCDSTADGATAHADSAVDGSMAAAMDVGEADDVEPHGNDEVVFMLGGEPQPAGAAFSDSQRPSVQPSAGVRLSQFAGMPGAQLAAFFTWYGRRDDVVPVSLPKLRRRAG